MIPNDTTHCYIHIHLSRCVLRYFLNLAVEQLTSFSAAISGFDTLESSFTAHNMVNSYSDIVCMGPSTRYSPTALGQGSRAWECAIRTDRLQKGCTKVQKKTCFFDFVPFVRKCSRNTTHKTGDFPRAPIYDVMCFTRALWRLPVVGGLSIPQTRPRLNFELFTQTSRMRIGQGVRSIDIMGRACEPHLSYT